MKTSIRNTKGLTILNTGNGKGKTTAALGMLMRAHGHGQRICVIQFIKRATDYLGEVKTAKQLGIEWHATGIGFRRVGPDSQRDKEASQAGWALSQEKIASDAYDMIVLDEFTYPLHFGWLDTEAVINWIAEHKPPRLHLVITGRYAPPALIEFADLVTEMSEVKHPYQQGISGQPGVEF